MSFCSDFIVTEGAHVVRVAPIYRQFIPRPNCDVKLYQNLFPLDDFLWFRASQREDDFRLLTKNHQESAFVTQNVGF